MPLAGGLALFAAGLAWLAQVTTASSFAAGILGPSLLVGAGLGLAFVSLTIGAVSGVPGPQAGLASGLINSSQQIGGALGLAIAATAAAARTTQSLASGAPAGTALTAGFRLAFLAAAAFAALGMVAALTLIGRSRAVGSTARQSATIDTSGQDLPRLLASPGRSCPEQCATPNCPSRPGRRPNT